MTITGEEIAALSSGELTHLHLVGHYPVSMCKRLAEWASEHPDVRDYRASDSDGRLIPSDTMRVGYPLSELYRVLLRSTEPDGEIDQYFKQARKIEGELKGVCVPSETPIEALSEVLDNCWPGGAKIAQLRGHPTFVGVIRIMNAAKVSAEPQPHVDWVPPSIFELNAQLSAITYLSMPEIDGELEVWRVDLAVLMELVTHHGKLRRCDLPAPCVIRPCVGDLVVINTRRAHAVRGFTAGVRIAQTAFIGMVARDAPLIMWS